MHMVSIREHHLLVACLALVVVSAARGQDAPTVSDVRFEGAVTSTTAFLQNSVRTRPGQLFDQVVVDEDVTRLLRTGRFLIVTAQVADRDDGKIVTFIIQERPTIQTIVFEGNVALASDALMDEVPIKIGDPIDLYAVREGREAILYQYHRDGFGYVTVQVDEEAVRTTGHLVYRIEEGPKVRVRRIHFEGATVFPERTLRKQIQTKTALWIFRVGAFDEERVAADAAAVQEFYRREGYLDARVSYRVDPGAEPGDLNVVFTVDEAAPYTIETIRLEGNTVRTTDEIFATLASKPGQLFKQDRLDTDTRGIQKEYGRLGYIYAQVRSIRVFSATPGFVVLTIQIREGPRMNVGRIVVRGNQNTQDRVIRRVVQLYPGDTFDLTKIEEAETNLRQSQLFERVSITPVGDEPDVRDIVIDVTENERLIDFMLAFGVTSDSGLVGNILLDFKNFDIFDTPRSFSEFIRFRAFRGAGQRLRLELQPGTELNRFRADFTEPYLFDEPLRFDLSLFHFTREREAYDERRTGVSVAFGKRLEKGIGRQRFLRDWYAEVAFGLDYVELDDVDIFDDRDVRDVEGGEILPSVKLTLVRDRTDNRFIPSSGDRVSLSYEQFIGSEVFGKVRAQYARHWTTTTDREGRKSVVSFRVDGGAIAGDAPVYERFYAGGIGSIRGFDFRGIGPRGGLEKDPIGGDFLLTTSTEYSFPLAGEMLRGVVFLDMGTVEQNLEITDWRAAIGFGMRMTIELLGPVPIELDFGVPIAKGDDDDTRVFSFFIGGSF